MKTEGLSIRKLSPHEFQPEPGQKAREEERKQRLVELALRLQKKRHDRFQTLQTLIKGISALVAEVQEDALAAEGNPKLQNALKEEVTQYRCLEANLREKNATIKNRLK